MFLKSIVINGFKSFALRRELLIHEGITGIVGPNGSGKSNIADALRWVLGEQSSRSLRGSSMQEVIFKGTQTRPPKASCEVSLLFDNSDGHFDVPYAEVAVKRRLYRSGESEYSINGTNCRLKDVTALFRDTGLGKDGYSIIGQGRINRILDSRASERRLVFDEAAGIMKYRSRKDEAERNLAKTQENLQRLADITAELKAQAEPLRVQVKAAGEYRELAEELRTTEVNILLYTAFQQRAKKEKLEQTKGERENELQQTASMKEEAAVKRQEAREAVRRYQQELAAHETRAHELARTAQQAEAEAALQKQKAEDLAAVIRDADVRHTRLSARYAAEEKELAVLLPEAGQAADRKKELEEKLRLRLQMPAPDTDIGIRRDEKKSRIERLREVISARQAQALKDQRSLGMAVTEMDRLTAEGKTLSDRAAALAAQQQENGRRRAQRTYRLQEIAQNAARLKKAGNTAREKAEEAQQAVMNLDRQISSDEARANLVSELLSSHEGYYESIRALFSHLPPDETGVFGTVADVVQVESRYETAVETALGSSMQDVITASDAVAKRLIDLLTAKHLGRVTFLPVDSLRVRYLQEAEKRTIRETGLIGSASQLISCDEKVRPAADYLLARTVVAEDLDQALDVKKQHLNTFRIVTLRGDIVVPGGAITGGSSRRPKVSLLARRRMAEELRNHLKQLKDRRQQEEEQRRRFVSEAQHLDAEAEKAEAAFQEEKLQDARDASEYERLLEAAGELQTRKTAWEADLARAAAAKEAQENTAQSGTKDLETLLKELAREEDGLAELDSQAEALRTAGEKRRAEIAGAEKELAACDAQLKAKQRAVQQLQNTHTDTQKELAELAGQLRTHTAAQKEAAGGYTKEKETAANIRTAAEETEAALEKTKRRLRREEENLDFYTQQLTETDGEENEKSRELYRLEADIEKCQHLIDTVTERLWNEYELTWANALKLRRDPFAAGSAREKAADLREKITALGPVNFHALEDWEHLKERLEETEMQTEDLQAAAADLQVVTAELMQAMKKEFEDKFARINAAFSRTFAELFGGGSAKLVLEEGVPAMDAGVEIRAEPPGKKLQNIALLSDGEKAMTAIALCFAMLEVNPSPVCLLDEIDAPLDDRNVVRLSEYLAKLKDKLQFLVITHKKTTMSVCDTLYGVAMHEKGVTDLVSVAMD